MHKPSAVLFFSLFVGHSLFLHWQAFHLNEMRTQKSLKRIDVMAERTATSTRFFFFVWFFFFRCIYFLRWCFFLMCQRGNIRQSHGHAHLEVPSGFVSVLTLIQKKRDPCLLYYLDEIKQERKTTRQKLRKTAEKVTRLFHHTRTGRTWEST